MKRSLFRYYGGKWHVAPWIISFFPEHRHYIEPFGGAGSVLMRKERSYSEMLNDMNKDIINFYRVLQSKSKRKKLRELLKVTPYSRDEYDKAHRPIKNDMVERARRLLIRASMGYNADSVILSNSQSGFRNNCDRQWTTPAHNWVSYPDYLEMFAERLHGVIIESVEAEKLFAKFASKEDMLWYLDPPYVHSTRKSGAKHGYAFEMSDDDHIDLVEFLREIKGMIVLSGYDTDIYLPLEESGWVKLTKHYANYSGYNKDVTECVWLNPQCIAALNEDRDQEQQLQFEFGEI